MRRSEWTTQPWKNGRGVTHEIWRWIDPKSEQADPSAFDLRVSVAEIEGAQPFSLFPGIWRTLIPLEESALSIVTGPSEAPLTKHHAFHFPGDVAAATKGEGRASDLNVMAPIEKRAHVEVARLETHRKSKPIWPTTRSRPLAVFALERTILRAANDEERTLEKDDLFVHPAPGADYSADVPVVWIRY